MSYLLNPARTLNENNIFFMFLTKNFILKRILHDFLSTVVKFIYIPFRNHHKLTFHFFALLCLDVQGILADICASLLNRFISKCFRFKVNKILYEIFCCKWLVSAGIPVCYISVYHKDQLTMLNVFFFNKHVTCINIRISVIRLYFFSSIYLFI